MTELLSSKVVVIEEQPTIRGIQSAPTSTLGALGLTERGPVGVPVRCDSFEAFQAVFGGFVFNAQLPLALMGFFENGGSVAWVVRTAHYGDASDILSLTARPAFATLEAIDSADAMHVHGKTPGAFANRLEVEVREGAAGFDLRVLEDGILRERFADLSMLPSSPRFAPSVIHHERRGSRLIRVEPVGDMVPAPQTVRLSGGDDGLSDLDDNDFIGNPSAKTGMHAFDAVQDLALLIVPDRATAPVHQAMVRYCEVAREGILFAILDPPPDASAAAMVQYVETDAALLELSEFGALYWPRVQILNPAKAVFGAQTRLTVAPSGVIAGVFARTDNARAGGVYEPPAGIDRGRLLGVLGFESDEVLEERKRDLIYPKRINPLTTSPGLPRYIDGSRTLRSEGSFPYVGERRGVIFIARSLKRGLEFARHRNNNEALRAEVRRTVKAFLLTQMNNGAFRSREPDKAFFVDVSEQLNNPTVVMEGQLILRVGLATNKPAEFIILKISADTRALEAALDT
jgi:uncharacterized protein